MLRIDTLVLPRVDPFGKQRHGPEIVRFPLHPATCAFLPTAIDQLRKHWTVFLEKRSMDFVGIAAGGCDCEQRGGAVSAAGAGTLAHDVAEAACSLLEAIF